MDGNSLPRPRPFGVTLFLWMVLSLSVWGLLRLSAALTWRDVLTQFHASLSPLYLSITGAGWAVVGLLLLWSIWAGKRWAHPAIPISIALWLAEYWIERIFFEASRANLPFTLFLSLILLAATFLISFNRKTKDFLLKKRGP
jgi:hypothetical protein